MSDQLRFRLLLVLMILTAAVTVILPSDLLDYLSASGRYREKTDQAPPLTDYLRTEEAVEQAVTYEIPEALPQPIIVYHHVRPKGNTSPSVMAGLEVTPEVFEAHLGWLQENGWQTVFFSEYLDYMDGLIRLPEKSVVITFDDGNRNQYDYALPLLRQYQAKATFFVYPNAIGRRDDFMNWDQLKEVAAAGMEIGSHSMTHPRLYQMTDRQDIQNEVVGSRNWLEEELGAEVEVFAYPFGRAGRLDEAVVREAGYRAARIYPYGPDNTPEDRFQLKSVAAPNSLPGFVRLLP